MLTTNLRTTQSLDPTTGVARPAVATSARPKSVTAPAYRNGATRPFATAFGTTGVSAFANASWASIECKPMPKVDLHPDRWPLQSTS